jgi:hypothetical protein
MLCWVCRAATSCHVQERAARAASRRPRRTHAEAACDRRVRARAVRASAHAGSRGGASTRGPRRPRVAPERAAARISTPGHVAPYYAVKGGFLRGEGKLPSALKPLSGAAVVARRCWVPPAQWRPGHRPQGRLAARRGAASSADPSATQGLPNVSSSSPVARRPT